MARVTPQEYAEKLARRLSAATEDIRRGIERVRENPMEAAAAQQDLLLQRLQEVIQSGRWAELVRAVSLQEWKSAATQKGVPRIGPGIQAARPKLERFATQLLPAVDAAVAEVKAMPKTTLEDRINRAVSYMRRMSQFKKSAR